MGHPRGLILYPQITRLQDIHDVFPADKCMGL
jgi:hypothetical protein